MTKAADDLGVAFPVARDALTDVYNIGKITPCVATKASVTVNDTAENVARVWNPAVHPVMAAV